MRRMAALGLIAVACGRAAAVVPAEPADAATADAAADGAATPDVAETLNSETLNSDTDAADAVADAAPTTVIDKACAVLPPTLASDRLHAEGTQLLDAIGRRVLLRGVNASGRAKLPPFAPFEFAEGQYQAALASYLDRAEAWGIDVIRAPFTWEAVEPVRGQDDEAFLQRYDALIAAAWARRIWVVVDFHQDVYTRAFCGDGFPLWTLPAVDSDGKAWPAPHADCPDWFNQYFDSASMAVYAFDRFWHSEGTVRQDFAALWQRLAKRYKDRPGVIALEIINEPMAGSALLKTWEATTLSAFYHEMTALLHAEAPQTLVAWDTSPLDALSFATSIPTPTDAAVVFAPHWYDPSVYGAGKFDLASPQKAIAAWKAVGDKWQVPTWIGETGYPFDRPDAPLAARELYDALDAHAVHATWWEYSVAKTGWNAEMLSLVDGDGQEHVPALVEAIARPYPRALAGSDAKWQWDGASRTFTLSFVATAGGVSEIALPRRAFASGWTATLAGDACAAAGWGGSALLVQAAGGGKVKVQVVAKP